MISYTNDLAAAARAGNLDTITDLVARGADVNQRRNGDYTPIMDAAMAGKHEAVALLLDLGADATARAEWGQSLIKLALDHGHRKIAEAIVARYPNMHVNDPRLPKGAAFLREQHALILEYTRDPASRPDSEMWEGFIRGDLGPAEGCAPSVVYWRHIFLCLAGDRRRDVQLNYSTDLKQVRIGAFNKFLEGHAGLKQAMHLQHSVLPTTKYVIADTVVRETDKTTGWVTERWGYHDPENGVQVTDGIDTFLVSNGKIIVKMVNYNVVGEVDSRSEFDKKVGI